MGDFPLVSVIVPAYNSDKTLGKCVESVVQQVYKQLDIIVVNDGSTDGTELLCKRLKLDIPNFRYISKKNEGLGKARNSGMKIAKGDYILFLDSDDYLSKNCISDLMEIVILKSCEIAVGGGYLVSESGEILSDKHYGGELYEGLHSVKHGYLPRRLGSQPNAHDYIGASACGVIYSRRLIEDNEIFFDSERDVISEDRIFNIKLALHARSVYLSDKSYYYYVKYDTVGSSLTSTYRSDRFDKVCELFKLETSILSDMSLSELDRWRQAKSYFLLLKMCISQVGALDNKAAYFEIQRICSSKLAHDLISNYPIGELEPPQAIFVWLIKLKLIAPLLLSVRLGVM